MPSLHNGCASFSDFSFLFRPEYSFFAFSFPIFVRTLYTHLTPLRCESMFPNPWAADDFSFPTTAHNIFYAYWTVNLGYTTHATQTGWILRVIKIHVRNNVLFNSFAALEIVGLQLSPLFHFSFMIFPSLRSGEFCLGLNIIMLLSSDSLTN